MSPSTARAEAPQEVIQAVCGRIADALKPVGFNFAASRRLLTRKRGDLTCVISFQSDRHNVAGGHVRMLIHAGVSSRRIAAWAASHDSEWIRMAARGGRIAGGQIGNLREPRRWLDWQFVDSNTREAVTEDAIATIREIGLPFFTAFEDIDTGIDWLTTSSDSMWLPVAYALAMQGKAAAEQALAKVLQSDPIRAAHFREHYEHQLTQPLPLAMSGDPQWLAAWVVAAGLTVEP